MSASSVTCQPTRDEQDTQHPKHTHDHPGASGTQHEGKVQQGVTQLIAVRRRLLRLAKTELKKEN